MKKVHCDGCGFTESDDLRKSEQKISSVSLYEGPEPRWTGDGKASVKADLCGNCKALMLHTYFKVPMSDKLELAIPTFILPDELEEIPEAVRPSMKV
jgi:hypothetical protein